MVNQKEKYLRLRNLCIKPLDTYISKSCHSDTLMVIYMLYNHQN